MKTKTKIVSWNVRGITGKEQEIKNIHSTQDIDFAAISETKKKGQGTNRTPSGYVVIQTGVNKDRRAAGGVMLYISKKYENAIKEYDTQYMG